MERNENGKYFVEEKRGGGRGEDDRRAKHAAKNSVMNVHAGGSCFKGIVTGNPLVARCSSEIG